MPVINTIQVRRDTAANWTSVDPTLAAGELGLETNTGKFKFGNGTDEWTVLPYAAGEGGGGGESTFSNTFLLMGA